MADRKITDLTALTAPTSSDVLPIVDVSEAAAADKNKKITVGELFKGVPDGSAAAPAIAFETDDGNGLFLSTTDTIGIATNGVSRATVSTTAVTSTLPVIVPDGSAAAPSVAFTGSGTDTGVYAPGADQVGISTGGTARVHVGSTGLVGVGSTSPSDSQTFGNAIDLRGSTGSGYYSATSDNTTRAYFATYTGAGYVGTETNHPLVVRTNNTERFRCDASGRLLVGTSTATNNIRLDQSLAIVTAGSTYGGASLTTYGGTTSGYAPVLDFQRSRGTTDGSFTKVELNDALGAVVFRGSDGSAWAPAASIEGFVDAATGPGDMGGRLVFFTTRDGLSSPSEKLRIDNAGTILADGRNGTSAQIFYSILPSPGTARNHFFGNTVGVGTWALQGNGTSTWTSDERRKKNIETTRDGYLEDLAQLRVVKYNWNVQSDDEPKELGLIAQEVEQIFPGLVIEADEPQEGDDYKLKSVKFSVLPFMLLKALQEAAAKIEVLEAKVAALENA